MSNKNPCVDDNPFADKPTLLEGIARELSGVDEDDIAGMIRRIAEVDDELSRRGAALLLKEKEELRKSLKKQMLATECDVSYDELSDYESVLTPQTRDVYDMERLEAILTSTQEARYIRLAVDVSALKEGVASGDVSRAALEKASAVKKEIYGVPKLYVRKRKESNDDKAV